MALNRDKTHLAKLMATHFPGVRFTSAVLRRAGKRLKNEGDNAAVAILRNAREHSGDDPGDVTPPAKCRVLSISRPFSEWPLFKVSHSIQDYFYKLSKVQYEQMPTPGTSKLSHSGFFAFTGLSPEFTTVAGLNKLFANVVAVRNSVLVKVENHNEKRASRGEEPMSAYGEDGYLLQPPGVNNCLYCWKGTIKLLDGYDLPIPALGDRLAIPPGQPGYVPEHDRRSLKRSGRIRAHAGTPIIGRIQIGDDFVTFDLRGLLRNVRWRFRPLSLTPRALLDYFTGDPVIDTRSNTVTFSYKEGRVSARRRDTVRAETRSGAPHSPGILRAALSQRPLTLISIDLGVTNKVAARASDISPELTPTLLDLTLLPKWQLKELDEYQHESDRVVATIREAALSTLTSEQRHEVVNLRVGASTEAKAKLIASGISPALSWHEMSSTSCLIADSIRDRPEAWIDIAAKSGGNKGKVRRVLRRDSRFAHDLRPQLSKETNSALMLATFALQKSSDAYVRLSRWKTQLGRQVANDIQKWAQSLNPRADVAFNIEDLNVRMFHGAGKRAPGWDGFFAPKREGRWFMQLFHKAISELAKHRGVLVIESPPFRTSVTCPDCGHVDKDNRDGEEFRCLGCGVCYNADLDVATFNIEKVALTGRRMPYARERLGGDASTGDARTAIRADSLVTFAA